MGFDVRRGDADVSCFRGPGAFGRAYAFMLEHDAHKPGSVDRQLMHVMVRLCPQMVDYLYGAFTPLHILYSEGAWPIFVVGALCPGRL